MAGKNEIPFSRSNEFLQAHVAKHDVTYFADTNHDQLAIRTFMKQNFAAMVKGGVTDLVLEVPDTDSLRKHVKEFMEAKPGSAEEEAALAAHWGTTEDSGEKI